MGGALGAAAQRRQTAAAAGDEARSLGQRSGAARAQDGPRLGSGRALGRESGAAAARRQHPRKLFNSEGLGQPAIKAVLRHTAAVVPAGGVKAGKRAAAGAGGPSNLLVTDGRHRPSSCPAMRIVAPL